jgi:hypothetical protein
MDSMINRIQQAASQARQDCRGAGGADTGPMPAAPLDWLTAPCRKSSPMPKAVPFLARYRLGQHSQLAEQWGIRGQGRSD